MRSWISNWKNNNNEEAKNAGEEVNENAVRGGGATGGPDAAPSTSRLSSAADAFTNLARRGIGTHDAEVERKVSLAARNLCYGVQRIVVAAKGKSGVEWKGELLALLGGADDESATTNASGPTSHSDIDVLLAAPKSEKFVQRCLENELPPNMIHCLRLLRVLELQHASQTHQKNEAQGKSNRPIRPISSRATSKVCQLLITLCTDSSVGEQLRPHLFGLLALSGASYPLSGVHVARAASQVIILFSERCLSTSLVWFLHDRKMIIHMTDDIKELCGQSAASTSPTGGSMSLDSNQNGDTQTLYGKAAEAAGLWAISLSTVVHLVVNSCRHDCRELLKDFQAAKGDEVLKRAIIESKSVNGKKLTELLPIFASCRTAEQGDTDNDEIASIVDPDRAKLASNKAAFKIMEDLMYDSILMLNSYVEENGKKPEVNSEESIKEMATYALNMAVSNKTSALIVRASEKGPKKNDDSSKTFDVATDLLLSALQLYSEHVQNYDVLEEQCHFLTLYILAFPTLEDENLKVLILKTVEFVVTGITGSKALQPFSVLSQVFVSICKSLMEEGMRNQDDDHKTAVMHGLFADTDLINESLEKLFRFDGKVGPQIMQSGKITAMVNDIAQMLLKELKERKDGWLEVFNDGEGNDYTEPPSYTPFDSVCAAILKVLSLVMGYQARRNASLLSHHSKADQDRDIKYLLVSAIKELGDEAATGSLCVFEAIMISRDNADLLHEDFDFCFDIVDSFAKMMSKVCGVEEAATQIASKKALKASTIDEIIFQKNRNLSIVVLHRVSSIFEMIRNVLEFSTVAREAFRVCGGFEYLLKSLLSLGGSAAHEQDSNELTSSLLKLIQQILAVVDAGVGFKARNEPAYIEAGALIPTSLPIDPLVDPVSSQHGPRLASTHNLYYLRLRGFYLDLAIAVAQTSLLHKPENAAQVLELGMAHMDASFSLTKIDNEKGLKTPSIKNPDGARLILGLVLFLPTSEEGHTLAKRAFDQIIRLCDPSRLGTTLSRIAKSGIVWSITNPKEFSSILEDTSNPFYPRFTLLLRRIAAFSMSHSDFVSTIRCVAGPLLRDERHDTRVRLPVISSSIRQRLTKEVEDFHEEKDSDFCRRLETLCSIAERGERVPYCTMGGDSINTLSVLLHKTKVEDRLYKAADGGRLNFLEVDCLDLSSLKPGGFLSAGVAAPGSSGGERLWTPMAASGFSFSMWFRYSRGPDDSREGNIYLFDLSNPTISTSDGAHTPHSAVFLSVWYDVLGQQFNVVSSTSHRGEPTCFPVSPLVPEVWHHVLLTYTPTKRTMMGRKSVFAMYVDGRPLEAEIKIDSVNIAPNARVLIGAPNAVVSASGIVRGMITTWQLGPTIMLSTVLMELDATAIFIYGPDFEGLFWGDRPQRLSLSATGTAAFALLADAGEPGSVASALRRRDVARLEAAGTVSRELGLGGSNEIDNDSLGSLGLLCTIPPDCVVFAFRAGTTNKYFDRKTSGTSPIRRRNWSKRLVNIARINSSNDLVSTDASLFGRVGIVDPRCFQDNIQWTGGPQILMPLVFASLSSRSLALTLRLFRASINRHPPNLEAMQGGGGFQTLAILIQGKKFVDKRILEESFAFAVHGFAPLTGEESPKSKEHTTTAAPAPILPANWVFSDLDAMKQLLLNHQVWDLKNSGPELPLRLMSLLNGLVSQKSIHKAFNSRRLHLVGIIRWTLHLMVETADLYSAGEIASQDPRARARTSSSDDADMMAENRAAETNWHVEAPNVFAVSVGGDPDNPLLQACKTLLRRVLTFMLTPGDLDAIAEATMYTVSIGSFSAKTNPVEQQKTAQDAEHDLEKLLPGSVARVYLLRLIEELIVDGVNEIVASGEKRGEDAGKDSMPAASHAGGIANPNQMYFSTALLGGSLHDGESHPKHQQAQNFLAAFGSVFTPVWFAALLEGCNEEATASAVLRLMILMLQSSPNFAIAFEAQGGFAPLVLSIPKFSTCPTVILALLSELFHVSILHVPSLPVLDAAQLNEVFASEVDVSEIVSRAHSDLKKGLSDPSSGVFALLAECIGRNIQLAPFDNALGGKARSTNMAILHLLAHRHNLSPAFQEFCRTSAFIEPLSQTLCMVYEERSQRKELEKEKDASTEGLINSRRGSLSGIPSHLSPAERFVGGEEELGSDAGHAIVQLLRMVLSNSVVTGPAAPPLVNSLFSSFPVHATPEQVGAYQLILIDMIKATVEDAVDLGEATSLATSVGLCSVLLDKLMKGFFTSELILQTCAMTLFLLKGLASPESIASKNTNNSDLAMITADAAHIARLTCLSGLRRSGPTNARDLGDAELQDTLIQMTAKSINELMIVPKTSNLRRNSILQPAPSAGSKSFPLWQAASIVRCSPGAPEVLFTDLSATEEPTRLFIVGLMSEISVLLKDERDEVREAAVKIIVGLLQHRRATMSGLLIKEIETADNRVETIDVMNRGGFGALLVAHEVAQASGSASGKKNYSSFFEWYEKHAARVQIVFDDIEAESTRTFPGLSRGAETPDQAVEFEQQSMAMKLASQENSDRTIIGGLERAELAQRCIDRTGESHTHWKRQGFDDLASGAMQWKFLLRELKGSCSIWEGGPRILPKTIYARHKQLYEALLRGKPAGALVNETAHEFLGHELVSRWKLDLTEGNERQRRRLLPNYEFHGLYNIDEAHDEGSTRMEDEGAIDKASDHNSTTMIVGGDMGAGNDSASDFFGSGSGMEATAELLKELNIKKVFHKDSEDIYDFDVDDDDIQTEATAATGSVSELDGEGKETDDEGNNNTTDNPDEDGKASDDVPDLDNVASSYELITGLLRPGDWPEQSYNVRRCTGLEVRKALLLWCRDSIYIIDGFEQSGEGLDGRITRVEKEESSYSINLRPKDFKVADTDDEASAQSSTLAGGEDKTPNRSKSTKKAGSEGSKNEITYQHRSQRIAFTELHSVFRRRYQLQQIALEFYDIHHSGTLVSFSTNEEREEILSKVLSVPLPNSIFSSFMGTSINYRKFMSSWKAKIVSQWVNGKMTNFEFLMHMNSFAGRTYNDLTQYPVFPWVIADYDSEELDLNDPDTYRDLSKPMGALGPARAKQFKERYEALEASYIGEDDPPPFHYGTHYSCAAYVLYYLMRLEPFSRLALTLQGGRFDVADRLFHNVGSSWKSASADNLQDVRELIPEFYYLPDFLTNTNGFDFGITQKGKHVHDVTLPKWAHGDPKRFVRINRQALESEHVSKNLHLWVDLIFGYKQRGEEAVALLNTFVHVTYEGEVDLESMTDPVQRESTIAQIQNFGQTPSRLERRPFQQRVVISPLKDNDKMIDYGSLSYLAPLTPPFCVVGSVQRCKVQRQSTDVCKLGVAGQGDKAVGDLCLIKGQIIGVGRNCVLNIAARTYYRYGGPNYGVGVHVALLTARNRELNKLVTVHDGLHRAEISIAKPSLNGQWLVTGSVDSSVRLWKYASPTLKLCATFCGHEGWKITCIDICTVFGVIATGCAQGRVILWDLRTLTFVRRLQHHLKDDGNVDWQEYGATSVSINHTNGNIITLIGPHISIFDINGNLLGSENSLGARPSCGIATDCSDWQENGIVAVTGHVNGEVRFWSLDFQTQKMTVRYLLVDREHTTEITALRATGVERQDTLLVGDRSGKMSVCRTSQMENFSSKDIAEMVTELRKARGLDTAPSTT